MAKTIIVLGAGLAAVPIIRQTMRNVVLPSSDYKLVVVAPNTHFHWPLAMPRVVVPDQMPMDKAITPLEGHFKQYPKDKFEHILDTASALDPSAKTVTVGGRTLGYDYLIVATGSSARDNMPWKIVGTSEKTMATVKELHSKIKGGKKIVVAGGGTTGTELAGELGFEYSQKGVKEVYFVYNGDYPLPSDLLESVRKAAKSTLEGLKVKLISNTTVTKTTAQGNGTVLELTGKDGKVTSLTADVYLPAIGVAPNSAFAPKSMLNDTGYIKQTNTLRAEGYEDIFVVGDVGSLELSKAQIADAQSGHLIKTLPDYILKGTAIPEYKLDTKGAYAITLGRSKATGQVSGWRMPSIVLWYFKGRTFMTEVVEGWAAGKRGSIVVYEK